MMILCTESSSIRDVENRTCYSYWCREPDSRSPSSVSYRDSEWTLWCQTNSTFSAATFLLNYMKKRHRTILWPLWAKCHISPRKVTSSGTFETSYVRNSIRQMVHWPNCSHPKSDTGHVYIFTCVDAFTKWAEAFTLRNKEAETVAKVLVEHLFCIFGSPLSILSDQGRKWMAESWGKFAGCLTSTSYERHHTNRQRIRWASSSNS